MGKKYDTFPGEQSEMPVPKKQPEINQPSDPKEPNVPQENPDKLPEELPQTGDQPEKHQ